MEFVTAVDARLTLEVNWVADVNNLPLSVQLSCRRQ